MLKVSFYGKGGIGKSTISANVSMAFSEKGLKVLHIGCDPKHDSTRLLLKGRAQETVLDYVCRTKPCDRCLSDVVATGALDISCVEAGGPEPGVGCAGRGILSAFDILNKLGISKREADVRVQDVLGDVVCGGFAVPLRDEYSDVVYIVTSGEFMSIYAANNILKGIRNFQKNGPRLGGLILNCRGDDHELETVDAFARAVGIPVVAVIPRDSIFANAESASMTVMEMAPQAAICDVFRSIADDAIGKFRDSGLLCYSESLSDEQMLCIARNEPIPDTKPSKERSADVRRSEKSIVHSCATNGAVFAGTRITDAAVVIHGPRSCAHIMATGYGNNNLRYLMKGQDRDLLPISRRIYSTDMNDGGSILGSGSLLKKTLESVIGDGYRYIFAVTSCASGIIGDDVEEIVNGVVCSHPDVKIIPVMAEGNMTGDWGEGFDQAVRSIAMFMEQEVRDDRLVNIVGERHFFKQNNMDGDDEIFNIIKGLGLRIGCRFMYRSTMDEVKHFRRAGMNFLSHDDHSNRRISGILTDSGIDMAPMALPIGLDDTLSWLDFIEGRIGGSEAMDNIRYELKDEYDSALSMLRTPLEGKRAIVIDRFDQNVDWLLEVLDDVGVDVVRVGFGQRVEGRRKFDEHFEDKSIYKDNYTIRDLLGDIGSRSPDFVLGDSMITKESTIPYDIYSRPSPGVRSCLRYLGRISHLASMPTEGWRAVL